MLELSTTDKALLEENLKKARALYFIQTCFSDEIFLRVSNKMKAKDAWDVLEKKNTEVQRR